MNIYKVAQLEMSEENFPSVILLCGIDTKDS